MSRLRKKQIIPEGTPIKATLTDTKLVHGKFGRQVETVVKVTEGGENNEYKGTTFKTWFNFRRDEETKEEYINYGSPVYQLLDLVTDDLEVVLSDDNLSNADYEKFLKKAVRDLEDLEILARVGVKTNRSAESKKSNYLMPGTFGTEEEFEDLDMGESA